MSQETEWFEGKREHPRPIILPLICWIGVVLVVIFLLAGLSGCATTKEETADVRVCAFQLIGQTGSGLPVVKMQCVSPEAFAESQK